MIFLKSLHRVFSSLLLLSVMVLGLGNLQTINTLAAGVNVTVSPSITTVSNATSVVLGLTTTAAIPTAGLIEVVYPTAAYTGTPAIGVSAGTVGATTTTISGSDTIASVTVATTVPAGANVFTVTGLSTSATAGNNLFTVYTSAGDFGANFQYVGNANQVTVRAVVPVSLSFVIRNAADTANTNVCDMGNLSVTAIGSCSYRLKVSTNAQNGYTVSTVTTGGFTNGSAIFPSANPGNAGTGGTAQSAGTHLYGAVINKGSITAPGGTTALNSVFDAGVTNNVEYDYTTVADLVTANKPNNPTATDIVNTSLVTHQAAVNTSTAAGIYTQKVTYTVTPSFATVLIPGGN